MGAASSQSQYLCCTAREKQGLEDPANAPRSTIVPRFLLNDCPVLIEAATFVAFAPMHQKEARLTRRAALANEREVHVYEVVGAEPPPSGRLSSRSRRENSQECASARSSVTDLPLTHALRVGPEQRVAAVLFTDEDSSRHLAVALGPTEGAEGQHVVRVFNCEGRWQSTCRGGFEEDSPLPTARDEGQSGVIDWDPVEGSVACLEELEAPITAMVTHRGSYLLVADASGVCSLFAKSKGFSRRLSANLHPGGIADVIMDRVYVYSVGSNSKVIRVSALPDLRPLVEIPGFLPMELLRAPPNGDAFHPGPGSGCCSVREDKSGRRSPRGVRTVTRMPSVRSLGLDASAADDDIVAITLLKRPFSRWCGIPGTTRTSSMPRGWLFTAGVLRSGSPESPGVGVLMEWSLGEAPACQSARIAHDTPIVLLAYGPYDNGPVITSDAHGVMRIWETNASKGLQFSQQLDLALLGGYVGRPVVAVEQPRVLYVLGLQRRLLVWWR